MTRRGLLRRIDQPRIEAAIAKAEAGTTGEIRISVAGLFWGSSQALVDRAFVRLGMHRTQDRNGVLVVVLPWRRQLMVRADAGIDDKVGAGFWHKVVAEAVNHLRQGRYDDALLSAIASIGAVLAREFPSPAGGQNPDQLPNRVDRG